MKKFIRNFCLATTAFHLEERPESFHAANALFYGAIHIDNRTPVDADKISIIELLGNLIKFSKQSIHH